MQVKIWLNTRLNLYFAPFGLFSLLGVEFLWHDEHDFPSMSFACGQCAFHACKPGVALNFMHTLRVNYLAKNAFKLLKVSTGWPRDEFVEVV